MRVGQPMSVVVLAVLAVACGGEAGPSSTTLLAPPDVVVRDWMSAVDQADVATLGEIVAAPSLAFVIGIESRLAPDEITELAEVGPSSQVLGGFWRSFAESFAAIDGAELSSLSVGSSRQFDAGGARFSAVTIGSDDRSTEVFVRRSPEGAWEVDVLATVGSGLVIPLTDLAAQATDDRFRTLFEQWVLPGLEAAARTDGGPAVADAIRELRIVFDGAVAG